MSDEPETSPDDAPPAPPPALAETPPPGGGAPASPAYRPNFLFLAGVAAVSLAADLASKGWAMGRLENPLELPNGRVDVIQGHLSFILAHNRGGAWGLLQGESDAIRVPFFVGVSVAAIIFIVSLYRKLERGQHALMWGLPLVLGGALGNLIDRIRFRHVIDFIDYRGDWIAWIYGLLHSFSSSVVVTDHWPTFNVADIAICVGVGLMAVDMFTTRKAKAKAKADTDASEPKSDGGAHARASSEA